MTSPFEQKAASEKTVKQQIQGFSMKIILSRKGFDSSYGGRPSPVLPDGRMISLLIPSSQSKISYNDIRYDGKNTYADLMEKIFGPGYKLKLPKKKPIDIDKAVCHLDPDLNEKALRNRNKNWRPLFGQVEAASSHLSNQDVKKDDLFLFFGWFQKTKRIGNNGLQFDKTDYPNGFHAIYGYLKIGKIIRAENELEKWMKYHPHAEWMKNPPKDLKHPKTNTIYVAAKGGTFTFLQDNLILTKKGEGCRTHWNGLPRDVFGDAEISYHTNTKKYGWKKNFFLAAAKGQEFVVEDGGVTKWANDLIKRHIKRSD